MPYITTSPEPGPGGPDSFESFYRHHYPSSARLAYLLTGNATIAEDLVQDAFTAIHGKFAGLDQPSAYLRTTLVNMSRRAHRSRSREETRLRLVGAADTTVELEPDEIVDVLQRLPEQQRTLLVLRYWGDLTEGEIADVMGCRPGTVKSRSARALAALRKELQQ
jgi:RNA polymerase sigma-70 factor (sigma-E family)